MRKEAFTVVELVMILVLLTILARLAIPAYQAIDRQARAASVRGTLDEVRSAIKAYRSNEGLEGRVESWPGSSSLLDKDDIGGICAANHIFEDCDMPKNPFSSLAMASTFWDYVTTSSALCDSATRAGPGYGWCYDPPPAGTGTFWAGTVTTGVNENLW